VFKIQPNPTFEVPVAIISHGEEQTINITFRAKTRDEYQKILKSAKDDTSAASAFLELVEKWDADMSLDAAGVKALQQHRPGAEWLIIQAYGDKLIAARKGN
jgi:hypothetical protein